MLLEPQRRAERDEQSGGEAQRTGVGERHLAERVIPHGHGEHADEAAQDLQSRTLRAPGDDGRAQYDRQGAENGYGRADKDDFDRRQGLADMTHADMQQRRGKSRDQHHADGRDDAAPVGVGRVGGDAHDAALLDLSDHMTQMKTPPLRKQRRRSYLTREEEMSRLTTVTFTS
jgi:hypothetical protein